MGQATRKSGRAAVLFGAVALAMVLGAGVRTLWRARQDRERSATGRAEWIWYSREVEEPSSLRFRAWKDFEIGGTPPARAPARIFGARDWVLEVNGAVAASGSQVPGDPLRSLDLGPALRPGANRVAIASGSPNGVGGLLFWMDLGSGATVVTDGSWRVERLPAGVEAARPAEVWGRPPMYPWGYPKAP